MKKTFAIISVIILVSSLTFLVFVPAFQGKLVINPVLEWGPLSIRWYGLTMALAVLVGYFLVRKNAWKFGVSKESIDDYVFWLLIVGLLGARLYYAIFNYNYFAENPGEVYKIWHGGLSIYGAVLSGIIFSYLYAKNKAFTFYQLFDLTALSLPLAQAIGRFGNFFNQEAFGTATDLPWKMYVAPRFRPAEMGSESFFHPAFLYEAILDIVIFIILYKLVGKLKSGNFGYLYLLLYSLGRFFIEGIRVDSFIINGFRVDQIVAFILILVSGIILLKNTSSVRSSTN